MSNNYFTENKAVIEQMKKRDVMKKKFELKMLVLAKNDSAIEE